MPLIVELSISPFKTLSFTSCILVLYFYVPICLKLLNFDGKLTHLSLWNNILFHLCFFVCEKIATAVLLWLHCALVIFLPFFTFSLFLLYTRGPQTLGHGLVPVCGLLGTRLHSRRWAVGKWAKLHLYLQPLPITRITTWAPPPVRGAAALDSHRSMNPTVNCVCEGSRLHDLYENLMPDDLRWRWGSDVSAGEWLQIQIIISREVWLNRDHNKSIACRLISKPYQWVASENKLRAPTDSALWVV